MTTESTGNVILPPVDTFSTIYLQVNAINGGAIANMTWNPIATPLPSTSTGIYKIFREYPANNWTQIATTTALSYKDTIDICNAWLNYRIEIDDNLPCTSVSNVDGDQFKDLTSPVIPIVDSVSVDCGTGLASVSWFTSTSPDVTGYQVYQLIAGVWTLVGSVNGSGTDSYTNPASQANTQVEYYAVAAVDSCGNVSPISIPTAQNTMHLTAQFQRCGLQTNLVWNKYNNWVLGGYKIYCSTNAGPYVLVGTNASNDTTFSHTGLAGGNTYCYKVEAYNSANTKTASSNCTCVNSSAPVLPAFTYLSNASVTAPKSIQLSAYVDAAASTLKYRFERSDFQTGPYAAVGTVPFSGNPVVGFTDNSASPSKQSYYYRVVSVDSCNADAQTSSYARTIYLAGKANYDVTNTIQWNNYEGWLGGVSTYDIYRAIDGVWNPVPIATLPFSAGTYTYTDDVSPYLDASKGYFAYYIEGHEAAVNIYNLQETARSNVLELYQQPKFFVPNAFVPNGVNSTFIPVSGFIDGSDYTFEIFDRWGRMLFESHDRGTGWDGTQGGTVCQEGVYAYYIEYTGADGNLYNQRGSVTLIGAKKQR